MLYDLIDIREKNITEAQVTKAEKNRLRRQDTSVSDNNISQPPGIVNPDSKNSLPETDSKGKFSLPETDTASYDILSRENEDLKAQVEALENEMKLTKGHKVKPEEVKKLARKLLREYSSTMDVEELSAELEKIFNYVADTETAFAFYFTTGFLRIEWGGKTSSDSICSFSVARFAISVFSPLEFIT